MYQVGVLDFDGVVQSFKDQGYDYDKATNLAMFTVLNTETDTKKLSREDALTGYSDGDLTQVEARDLLVDIGYRESYANYLINHEDVVKQKKERDERIVYLKSRYIGLLDSKEESRAQLLKAGVTVTRSSELLASWDTQLAVSAKIPSKTDLDKFLRAKVIGDNEYNTEMRRLGYSNRYISWYRALVGTGEVSG